MKVVLDNNLPCSLARFLADAADQVKVFGAA